MFNKDTINIKEAARIKGCAPTTIYYHIHLPPSHKGYLHSIKMFGQYVIDINDVRNLEIKSKMKEKINER